jgi:putative membrane protein
MSPARARAVAAASLLTLAVSAAVAASSPDAVFITKAADGGGRTVEIAKVGAAKATSTAVKAFAQHLAIDHRVLNAGLVALAKAKDVTLPPAATTAPSELATRSGAAFDKMFLALMVKEHDAAISLFEGESRDGRDADVKEWAAQQLPALRDHLAKARSLAAGSS